MSAERERLLHLATISNTAKEQFMPNIVSVAVAAIAVFLFVGEPVSIQAAENSALNAEIMQLSREWERIKFQVENRDEQERLMAVLAQKARDIAQRYQNRPEAMIWIGISIGEQASMALENGSPIKALGFATSARDVLEKVEKIDPVVLDAGAPSTLGELYNRVPGFPIGFGDKSIARHYLREAIANAPNGLDANYFYGKFLYEQHEYTESKRILKRALTLPPLSSRPIWDQSLRLVIKELLDKMQG
jgi:tetratricopeptide (TPR) repeat protein